MALCGKIRPLVLNVPISFVPGSVHCSSALCLSFYQSKLKLTTDIQILTWLDKDNAAMHINKPLNYMYCEILPINSGPTSNFHLKYCLKGIIGLLLSIVTTRLGSCHHHTMKPHAERYTKQIQSRPVF